MTIGLGLGLGFGGVSGAAFTPKAIAGVQLWLRADLGITLAAGNVATWADQSGIGDANRNATQGSSGARPAQNLSNAIYNHQATVDCNASMSQFLQTGTWSVPLAQPATWIIVGHDTSATSVAIDGINSFRHLVENSSGSIALYAGGSVVEETASIATPTAILAEFNGSSSQLYVGNFTTPVGTGMAIGSDELTGLNIGQREIGDLFWGGSFAELVAFDKILSSAEKAELKNYINTRYGIAIT